MTTEEHNRTLGILHLVYGGLHALILLMVMLFVIPILIGIGTTGTSRDADGAMLMVIFLSIFALFWAAITIPSFVAGYGMLKRKSWAKVWAMVAGGVAGMHFPLGTALCVYTFWFLFSNGGNKMYENMSKPFDTYQPGVLHGAPQPADWNARSRRRDYTYVPPTEPPNWRGE